MREATMRKLATAAAAACVAALAMPSAAGAMAARMVVLPNPAVAGQVVHFDGSLSSGLTIQIGCPSSIDFYDWDFDGNGTVDASGKHVTHVYGQAGSYQASLTVGSDAEWCSTDTETQTVTVLSVGLR
jgi:PKD domain-containing protein